MLYKKSSGSILYCELQQRPLHTLLSGWQLDQNKIVNCWVRSVRVRDRGKKGWMDADAAAGVGLYSV